MDQIENNIRNLFPLLEGIFVLDLSFLANDGHLFEETNLALIPLPDLDRRD